MRALLIALALLLVASSAQAQCPGGVCPRPGFGIFNHRATRQPTRSYVRPAQTLHAPLPAVQAPQAPAAATHTETTTYAREWRCPYLRMSIATARAAGQARRENRQIRRQERRGG